jgi:hypothetical protein
LRRSDGGIETDDALRTFPHPCIRVVEIEAHRDPLCFA